MQLERAFDAVTPNASPLGSDAANSGADTPNSSANSSALLRAIAEHGAALILTADAGGTVLYLNEATALRLGHEVPQRFVGRPVSELVHPDDAERILDLVAGAAAKPGHSATSELRVVDGQGGWRHLEVTVSNMLDDATVAGIVLYGHDLARRDATHRRYRMVFEQSTVAQALVEPVHRGLIANNAFARLFAMSRDTLLTTTPERLTHPEHATRMVQELGA